MITLLKTIFLKNWVRKLISLFLAMIIWMVVNHSITSTKTVADIPVKITNLPIGKTVEGMQPSGYLTRKIALTLTGSRSLLNNISASDLEVIIDASNKPEEWTTLISKQNLFSQNQDIDLSSGFLKVFPYEMTIRQNRSVSEQIPITVTRPIGEAPEGYHFLDVWPQKLYVNLTGSEETLRRLKTRGLKLSLNLNNISKTQLETLLINKTSGQLDEVSFFIPNSWKKILIPEVADTPFEIDDPQANTLRIDFSREELLPIQGSVPITVYYPQKYRDTLNPESFKLATNQFVTQKHGIKTLDFPLYAQGVSQLFLDTVKDMIQVVIIASPKSERDTLLWSADFLSPQELENRYVTRILSTANEELVDLLPHQREEYLRHRFRSYMHRFRLFTENNQKLKLQIALANRSIVITPENYP